MPIMVGHSDKTATYASAEQMFLAHVVHTLSPWYQRIEQSADVNLLSDKELEAGFYTKFTPNALMRGAAADRAQFYAQALGSGGHPAWMTANEVRGLEEMDRIDGGDELAKPTNPAAPDPASAEE
jgi:phage portal protein BeeE